MEMLTIIMCMVLGIILIAIAGIEPKRTDMSLYELERRKKQGDKHAAEDLRHALAADDILSLRHAVEVLLLVLITISLIYGFGYIFGGILAFLVAMYYRSIAQFRSVHQRFQSVYAAYESLIVKFVEKNALLMRALRSMPPSERSELIIGSREELEHVITRSHHVLREDEKKMFISSLHFDQKAVEDVMTPRGVIESIDVSTVLGPLVLSDLHKTGHTRFPVIDGDIDQVVGVLHIQNLLTLHDKQSRTAGELMDTQVFYIHQDQNLRRALSAFLRTHHHMFIVINDYRETAGLVTIEDVMEALMGRRIMDEYDVHDDLRVVAERSAKKRNNPPGRRDV